MDRHEPHFGRGYPDTHSKDPAHLADSGKVRKERRMYGNDHKMGKGKGGSHASLGYHAGMNGPVMTGAHGGSAGVPLDKRSTSSHLKPAGKKDMKLAGE